MNATSPPWPPPRTSASPPRRRTCRHCGRRTWSPPAATAPASSTPWPIDVADLFARLREVAQSHLPDVEAARVVYLGDGGGRPVTRDELQQLAKTTTVTVLDVRPPEEYTAGHIPDAISIPLDELADRLAELPDDGQIVAYCRGAYCVLAHDAVRLLRAHSRDAARLEDGMLEWRLADLPVTT